MSLILIIFLQLSLLFRHVVSNCATTSDLQFTFYGFPDGPSDTTSFGCSGTTQVTDGTAGGDGSYGNPETFATAANNPNFVPCEIIYIPLLQKYFQYMDHCEACKEMYPSTVRIDLWIGSDVNGGQKQTDCELSFGLKTGQTIVRNPPSTLTVHSSPMWDNDSGTCNDDTAVFPNYSASEADVCAGASTPPSTSGGSTGGGSPAATITTTTPSNPPASTPSTPAGSQNNGAPPSGGTAAGNGQVDTVAKVAKAKANQPSPTTLATVVSVPTASAKAGIPCHNFNDCLGGMVCQGWPNAVCTSPRGGN